MATFHHGLKLRDKCLVVESFSMLTFICSKASVGNCFVSIWLTILFPLFLPIVKVSIVPLSTVQYTTFTYSLIRSRPYSSVNDVKIAVNILSFWINFCNLTSCNVCVLCFVPSGAPRPIQSKSCNVCVLCFVPSGAPRPIQSTSCNVCVLCFVPSGAP